MKITLIELEEKYKKLIYSVVNRKVSYEHREDCYLFVVNYVEKDSYQYDELLGAKSTWIMNKATTAAGIYSDRLKRVTSSDEIPFGNSIDPEQIYIMNESKEEFIQKVTSTYNIRLDKDLSYDEKIEYLADILTYKIGSLRKKISTKYLIDNP